MALLWTLLSVLLQLWCALTTPSTMHCPKGWWLNGVTKQGRFECRSPTYGDDERTRGGDIALVGRIYCDDGLSPVAANHFTATCKRVAEDSR